MELTLLVELATQPCNLLVLLLSLGAVFLALGIALIEHSIGKVPATQQPRTT